MRAFEVSLKKNRTEEATGFTWPSWWGEVEQYVDVIAYEDSGKQGKVTEGCVCVTDDDTWADIAEKKDEAIKLLNESSANEKGRAWRPQIDRITDQASVLMALAKTARGESLTAREKKVLDPEDETPGIGKSTLFDIQGICDAKGRELSE